MAADVLPIQESFLPSHPTCTFINKPLQNFSVCWTYHKNSWLLCLYLPAQLEPLNNMDWLSSHTTASNPKIIARLCLLRPKKLNLYFLVFWIEPMTQLYDPKRENQPTKCPTHRVLPTPNTRFSPSSFQMLMVYLFFQINNITVSWSCTKKLTDCMGYKLKLVNEANYSLR